MDTETMFASAGDKFAKEYDFITYLLDRYIVILDALESLLHLVQLMVMGCKQGFRMSIRMFMDIFHDSPSDGNAIISTRPASQFIKENQTSRSHVVQDIRRFIHLNHKGRFTYRDIIRSTHTGKYLIHNPDTRTFRRHKATYLCHKRNQSRLTEQSRFTSHVRSGYNDNLLLFFIQIDIVGYIRFARLHLFLDNRMPAGFDINDFGLIYDRTDIPIILCRLSKGQQTI